VRETADQDENEKSKRKIAVFLESEERRELWYRERK
jgi:hypothetical protein